MCTFRCITLFSLALWSVLAAADPFGTAFTYQGQLQQQDQQADGAFDFSFALFDAELDGVAVTAPIELENILVTAGIFSVELDFGVIVQSADEYWMKIGVRPGSSMDSHTILAPRQYLYPSPRSIYALRASSAAQSDLADDAAALEGHPAANFALTAHDHGEFFWKLNGNAGTTGASFLGTTDNQALELRVNAGRALRLEPDATSPNVLGGYAGNAAAGGTSGATISGGGRDLAVNQVTADFATVGGGAANTASGYAATIGGGEQHGATAAYATIGGGQQNSAGAHAVAGGGESNQASGSHTTVGGGSTNSASGNFTAIGGGFENLAGGNFAAVGGGSNNAAQANYAAIAGGGPMDEGNPTTTNNRVSDNYGAVGGGGGNRAGDEAGTADDATFATVAGGRQNTAASTYASVGGGNTNSAGAYAATVAGGDTNNATGNYATVSGGNGNTAAGQRAVAAGGMTNSAGNAFSTVSGGLGNTASGLYASVPGGQENTAAGQGSFAAGYRASADHAGAFVWADSSADAFSSTNDDQFLIKASGGVGIGTDSPEETLTVSGGVLITGENDPLFRGSVVLTDSSGGQSLEDVQVIGQMGFAVNYSANTFHTVDVSDPENMVDLALTTNTIFGPGSLQIIGQRAYVPSQGGGRLSVMDVSDLSDPKALGTIFPDSDWNPRVAFVAGRYAYVVSAGDPDSPTDPIAAAFEIFDISNPLNITAKDRIETNIDNPSDIYVAGAYACITNKGNNTLAIFDISNPDDIVARGTISDQVSQPSSVHVSGTRAFVTMQGSNALVSYDFSDPDNIMMLGQNTENLSAPHDVVISGRYAYVASSGNGRLAVFDVSAPANMIALGYATTGLIDPRSVTVAGERVYVTSHDNASMVAFDVNHLESPAIQTGSIQASQIDITDYARVTHLDVAGGLNVGLAGAMINGDVAVDGVMAPAADDTHSLGETGKRWTEVHAVNGVIQTSDGRLKDNVTPLSYGLAELTQLEPVAFSWKNGDPGETHLGLIAQEVREIFPQLVHGAATDSGTLGLNYGELVPVLINAVKELRGQVSDQTLVIETLNTRLKALEGK